LHLLAAIIWVGGMFFAHMALRPAVNQVLEPAQRLSLMLQVFDGFFPWVWLAVLVILGSGYWLLLILYQSGPSLSQWIMTLVGSSMALIFIYLYVFPYRSMSVALAEGEMANARASLVSIRRLIGINLVLGIGVTVVATLGKYSGF
jgi:uncharacterized membrane protein